MKLFLSKCSGLFLILFLCSFLRPVQLPKEDYQPGYYIDDSGKVEGYIYFTYDTYERFNFKKNLADKKSVKWVSECIGFSVDGKTFKVIENIELKIGIWNISANKAFAEVVLEGPMNLYKVYSMVGNGNMRAPGAIDVTNYVLNRDKSKSYVLAHPKKKKFKAGMAELFKDRMDIVEKINDGTYSLDTITELVKEYNAKL